MKKIILLMSFLISSVVLATPNEDMLMYVTKGYVDDLAEILISGEVQINYQDKNGNSALHMAVNSQNIEVLNLLLTTHPLSTQLYVNIKNNNQDTPFTLAVKHCNECVSILLNSNKKINLDAGGIPPLIIALNNQNDYLASDLIRRGAQSNIPFTYSNNDQTPLLQFLSFRNFPLTLKQYLNVNPNVNVRFEGKNTALMYASLFGKLENVKILTEAGALLNLRNEKGQTALMSSVARYGWIRNVDNEIASERFNLSVYEYLISVSAKTDFTNNNELTAANILEINKEFFANQDAFIDTLINLQKITPELSMLKISKGNSIIGASFVLEVAKGNFRVTQLETEKQFAYSFNTNNLTLTILDKFKFKFKSLEDLIATKKIINDLHKYSQQLTKI